MNKTVNRQKEISRRRDISGYSREFAMTDECIIPELELETFQPPSARSESRRARRERSVRFGWIGCGRCGCQLAETFFRLGYRQVLAVDASKQDLASLDLPEEQTFHISPGRFAVGKSAARVRQAVQTQGPKLFGKMEEIFGGEAEHFMLCFGAGGSTGGASAAGLIEWVQNYARLLRLPKPHQRVGVLMTLPSAGEVRSRRAAENARAAVEEMMDLAQARRISPLILADNETMKPPVSGTTVRQWRPAVNRRLAELFDALNTLSAAPTPYAAFDPMDYLDVLTAGGCTVMGLSKAEDERDKYAVSRALRNSLDTILSGGDYDLSRAKAAAGIIVGGREMMAQVAGLQDSINYAFDMLAAVTGRAVVHRGIYEDDHPQLRVYTLISGLPAPHRRIDKLRK